MDIFVKLLLRRYDVFHLRYLHEVVPNQLMGHILQYHRTASRLTGSLAQVQLAVLAVGVVQTVDVFHAARCGDGVILRHCMFIAFYI